MEETCEKLFNEAYELHVSGRLEEAKSMYEKLLESDSSNLDALNLYAQLNFTLKNYDAALKYFNEVYEKTQLDDIKINTAKVYLKKQDFENALKTLQAVKDKTIEVLRLEAQSYIGLNDYKTAKNLYIEVLNSKNASFSDIFNLSICCMHSGDLKDALKYSLEAAKIKPDKELLFNIGVLYSKTGDEENAVNYFNAVLEIEPEHKNALLNLAKIFQTHDKNISIKIYNELAEKYPKDISIHMQLCIMYLETMDYKCAYEAARKLIKLEPDKDTPYTLAADSLYKLGQYEEAVSMFKKAAEYAKNPVFNEISAANIYSVLNQKDKADEIFNKYSELKETNSTYAFIRLRERNIEAGGKAMYKHLTQYHTEDFYEKRALNFFYKLNADKQYGINETDFRQLKTDKNAKKLTRIKNYLKKDMYAQDIKGKRIFLYNANGIGDFIMFSRYIYLIEKYTRDITIQTPASMMRLMKTSFPKHKIISDADEYNENLYDYSSSMYCLLCSLKDVSLNNIPYSKGWMSVCDELIKEKSKFDFMKTDKKKIGLFWMGNPVIMPQRSIKLEELKPLFDIKNTAFYSFQIDKLDFQSEELKKTLPITDLAPYIKDYADTAAFLKNIDLLITIDSSIANLAGAIGVKTFLLLPFESEWRWFYDTDKTPWYDSIKIFKQKIPYEWSDVIERAKHEFNV